MEKKMEVREDGKEEEEGETRPPNVVILIKRERGDNMSKIKKYPPVWKIRHRTGNIRDHPQRYHINVGKRYTEGDYRTSDRERALSFDEKVAKLLHPFKPVTPNEASEIAKYKYAPYVDKDDPELGINIRPIKWNNSKYGLKRISWDEAGSIIKKKNLHFESNGEHVIIMPNTEIQSGHYRIKGWDKIGEHPKTWICKSKKPAFRPTEKDKRNKDVLNFLSLAHNSTIVEIQPPTLTRFLGESDMMLGDYRVKIYKEKWLRIDPDRYPYAVDRNKELIKEYDFTRFDDAEEFAKEWMKKHPDGV